MQHDEKHHWFSPDAATFGDRLAAAREAAGLSQEELSRLLGVKLKSIKGWEDDVADLRANRLQMLSGLLNVSIRWLLTGEGEGVAAPGEAPSPTADMRAILSELARMRAQSLALATDMGQIEKKLRALLKEANA
jgi:transcriptional regulator with XRE-family HTH domain